MNVPAAGDWPPPDRGDGALKFGTYRAMPDGTIVRVELPPSPPRAEGRIAAGPTRIGEWLLVDAEVVRRASSRLLAICEALAKIGAVDVVESTLVVAFLDADPGDRAYLLDASNWPERV